MLRQKGKRRKGKTQLPKRIPLPADRSGEPKDEYTTQNMPLVVTDGFVREEEPSIREVTGEMQVTNALLIAQVALDLYQHNAGDLRYAGIYRKVYNGHATDFEADVEVIMLALEDEIKRRGESGDNEPSDV